MHTPDAFTFCWDRESCIQKTFAGVCLSPTKVDEKENNKSWTVKKVLSFWVLFLMCCVVIGVSFMNGRRALVRCRMPPPLNYRPALHLRMTQQADTENACFVRRRRAIFVLYWSSVAFSDGVNKRFERIHMFCFQGGVMNEIKIKLTWPVMFASSIHTVHTKENEHCEHQKEIGGILPGCHFRTILSSLCPYMPCDWLILLSAAIGITCPGFCRVIGILTHFTIKGLCPASKPFVLND